MSYLLSIIIPTKNRYKYLKECLETLKAFDEKLVEIIIQDNSDDNSEIRCFLKDNNYTDNFKYFYCKENLSQTDNSDRALANATGEYCCYIGDDDSLSLGALTATKYLKENGFDACACDVSIYHWPDVVFLSKEKPPFSSKKVKARIKVINSKKVLNKFFSWGAQDIKYLARVYHGIVSRRTLNKIKEITGSYFPGPSPDMANAVACCLLINRYVYINAPLIISGYSYKSAGGLGLRGEHKGKLSEAKQLPKNAEKEWSERIPKIWLGYTVWPESAEKALIKMHHEAMIKKINYYAMEAKVYLKYKEYRNVIKERIDSLPHFLRLSCEIIRFGFRYTKERCIYLSRRLFRKQCIINKKISLSQAFDKTNEINNEKMEGIFNGHF